MSLVGLERPVSTKLRCRDETLASLARSSWLRWRRCRHWRSSSPAVSAVVTLFIISKVIAALTSVDQDRWCQQPIITEGHLMQEIIEKYIACWNERDPQRRRALIDHGW